MSTPSKSLNTGLWIGQSFLFVAFTLIGSLKLALPIKKLAEMWVWPGDLPSSFVKLTGVIDVLGGIGILLPAITRIKPELSTVAAACCTALQLCAIVLHASRGEFQALPLNFILLAVSAFVFWGRSKNA